MAGDDRYGRGFAAQYDPAAKALFGALAAELTNGRVPSGEPGRTGIKITQPGAGRSDIDVIGGDGSSIQVGGPAKPGGDIRVACRS
jgi:hypothetical protein